LAQLFGCDKCGFVIGLTTRLMKLRGQALLVRARRKLRRVATAKAQKAVIRTFFKMKKQGL